MIGRMEGATIIDRCDAPGTVARAWSAREMPVYRQAAKLARSGSIRILIAGPVLGAVAAGSSRRRSRAALAHTGLVVDAVIALLVFDGLGSSSDDLRRAIEALPEVGLDAFEDVLREEPGAVEVAEVERLRRAGLARAWGIRRRGRDIVVDCRLRREADA